MEALASAGHHVIVICPHGPGQLWQEVINGVHVYRFPTIPAHLSAISYMIEYLWATFIMSLLTFWIWIRHGMDVLHVYNPPESLFVAALLPKLAGKLIVFDLRDIAPELYLSKFEIGSRFIYRILVWLEKTMCQVADHVIVVNESYRQIVIERDHVAAEQISIVRQGPDITQVRPVDPDPAIRSRAKTIIAYLGSMAGQDGIDHLLKALHYLDRTFGYKDWLCVLTGPAENLQFLETLASELGVSDRTIFQGFLSTEQWLPILSSADICVEPCPANPLNNISSMNKIMDYMALGKPTVAYDLPEHRFTAGEAALYASPNDQVDFARQITRLIDDDHLCHRLGAIGRMRMEKQFAWQFQRERILSVYNMLSARK